jgi:hypothetical protein
MCRAANQLVNGLSARRLGEAATTAPKCCRSILMQMESGPIICVLSEGGMGIPPSGIPNGSERLQAPPVLL